jgi:hypothetical protein
MVIGVPNCALAPNAAYLMDCGIVDMMYMIGKFGWTSNAYDRVPDLLKDHPGCRLLMLVLTGTHNPKPIEDLMKLYCQSHRLTVQVRENKVLTECFKVPDETKVFFQKMRDVIIATHGNIIDTIVFGDEIMTMPKAGDTESTVLIEVEKTKQAQAAARQAEVDSTARQAEADSAARQAEADSAARQAEADSAARQAEANAQIRLAEISLERAKLGLARVDTPPWGL